jgi:hypothetical protein
MHLDDVVAATKPTEARSASKHADDSRDLQTSFPLSSEHTDEDVLHQCIICIESANFTFGVGNGVRKACQ